MTQESEPIRAKLLELDSIDRAKRECYDAALRELFDRKLSRWDRLRYLVPTIGGLVLAIGLGSVAVSEPASTPMQTRVLLATIAMGMVTSWALGERSRADEEARNARLAEQEQRRLTDAEELARRTAQRITSFVTEALSSADPNSGRTQGFLVTEAMDQAIAQLDAGELKEEPAVKARLLQTIAKILRNNYREDQALVLAMQALEINQGIYAGDHVRVAQSLNTVGLCYDRLGDFTEALRVFRLAHEMKQRLGNPIGGLHNVAYCLKELGRLDEALPIQREVLAHYSKIHSGDHRRVVSALDGLAASLQTLGSIS